MTQIVQKMKQKDLLFNRLYRRVFYGGSYYDGLKIEQPEEYDLDLLLALPVLANATVTASKVAGFVKVQLKGLDQMLKQKEYLEIFK